MSIWQTIRQYAQALRLKEVLLMAGFLCIGSLFALPNLATSTLFRLAAYCLASVFFVAGGYTLNAYGGYQRDSSNARLSALQTFSHHRFLHLTVLFNLIFIFGYAALSPTLLAISLVPYLLGFWYAYPEKGAKYYPVIGTIIHFISQIFLFHMGWIVFAPMNSYSLSVSIYFAILLSAAHLHHEVIDCEADKAEGAKTTAILLGKHKTEALSVGMYSLANLYWLYLYRQNTVEAIPFLPFFMAYIAQMLTRFYYNRQPLSLQASDNHFDIAYRDLYRWYYLAAGIVFAIYQLIQLSSKG